MRFIRGFSLSQEIEGSRSQSDAFNETLHDTLLPKHTGIIKEQEERCRRFYTAWVNNGSQPRSWECPKLGVKRKSILGRWMSVPSHKQSFEEALMIPIK